MIFFVVCLFDMEWQPLPNEMPSPSSSPPFRFSIPVSPSWRCHVALRWRGGAFGEIGTEALWRGIARWGDGGPGVSDGMAVMDTTLSTEMGWEDGLGDSVDDEGEKGRVSRAMGITEVEMMMQSVADVVVVRWLTAGSRQPSWMDFVRFDTAGIPRRQCLQPRLQPAAGRCDVVLLHGQGE